jgi:hypothetical protein
MVSNIGYLCSRTCYTSSLFIFFFFLTSYCLILLIFSCKRYSTVVTKEAARIGNNGFLFPHEYSGESHGGTQAGKKSLYSIRETSFCINSNVSNLHNNDVMIYRITQSRENSFVCERVHLILLLQHWSNS